MFDLFAKLLSSIASFLFPLFASYKALKTSDPAQLTPWLMYWVVLACTLLVESWVGWILCWIPFYAYIRLLFLLYLVLPQSQGARIIYQTHIHPYLQQNENKIDQLIATAHDRVKAAGLAYLRQTIEFLKTRLLGLPPREARPPSPTAQASPQTYTQSLLARFSVPSARWAGAGLAPAGAASAGADFYNFLASAVSTAMSPTGAAAATGDMAESGNLIPADLRGVDKMTFIAAQRERLAAVLTALDKEAVALEREDTIRPDTHRTDSGGAEEGERPPSRLSSWSGLSKSRSEVDFEKIEAESGAEEESNLRQRGSASTPSGGSWVPWGWGSSTPVQGANIGQSSAFEKDS